MARRALVLSSLSVNLLPYSTAAHRVQLFAPLAPARQQTYEGRWQYQAHAVRDHAEKQPRRGEIQSDFLACTD